MLPVGLLKAVFAEGDQADHVECARLLLLLLCTLGAALKNDVENARFFKESGAAADLCDNLSKSSVYKCKHARTVLHGLLQLATDTCPDWEGTKDDASASLKIDEGESLCDLQACLGAAVEEEVSAACVWVLADW